jgi:hypothetical protein
MHRARDFLKGGGLEARVKASLTMLTRRDILLIGAALAVNPMQLPRVRSIGAGCVERLLYRSLANDLERGRMTTRLNGKVVSEATAPAHTGGCDRVAVQGRNRVSALKPDLPAASGGIGTAERKARIIELEAQSVASRT